MSSPPSSTGLALPPTSVKQPVKGLEVPVWIKGWPARLAGQTSSYLLPALSRACGEVLWYDFLVGFVLKMQRLFDYLKKKNHFKLSLPWLVRFSKNLKLFLSMCAQKLNIKKKMTNMKCKKGEELWKKLKAELDIIFRSKMEIFLYYFNSRKKLHWIFLSCQIP